MDSRDHDEVEQSLVLKVPDINEINKNKGYSLTHLQLLGSSSNCNSPCNSPCPSPNMGRHKTSIAQKFCDMVFPASSRTDVGCDSSSEVYDSDSRSYDSNNNSNESTPKITRRRKISKLFTNRRKSLSFTDFESRFRSASHGYSLPSSPKSHNNLDRVQSDLNSLRSRSATENNFLKVITSSPREMLRLRKQHTIASELSSSLPGEKVPQVHARISSDHSDSETEDPFFQPNCCTDPNSAERLQGETAEDAEMRKKAVTMRRPRRRSSVVQIPSASIQMDLHTLYLENINSSSTKKKGKAFEEPKLRKLQKNGTVYGSFEGDGNYDTEKKGRFALLKQKFKKDDGQSYGTTLEDFKDFKEHLKSNLLEVSDHEMAKYKDAHWSTLYKFDEDDCECEKTTFHLTKLSDQERKRFEALWELLYAEISYLINNLVVMHDVFAKPLQHAKSFGFLSSVNESILFANLEELIQATSDFAKKLLKIFKECAVSVCRSTEIIVDGFKLFDSCLTPKYNEYSLNYQKAKAHLESLKENDIFLDFIRHCEQDPRCNRRHIEDFLVAPLQHLTKLPLLLKAIRKHSPQGDRNTHLLTTTIFDIEQSIKSIEKKISALMNLQRLREIQESVIWPVFCDMEKKAEIPEFIRADLCNNHNVTVLLNPNRQLLQEGALTLADNNKTEFYIFLFDDMLLLTKPRKKVKMRRNTGPEERPNIEPTLNRSKNKSMSDTYAPNYVVHKQPLPVDRLKIYDCDDQSTNSGFKNAFCLVYFNRYHQAVSAYTFLANNPEEKTLWLKNIKKAKDDATSEGFSSAKDISSDEEYML